MKSEEIKLNNPYIKINTNKDKNKEYDNITTTDIDEPIIPLINCREIFILPDSILNYLAIGICFVLYGFYGLEWFKISEEENMQFYLRYFLVAGICLYIIGIFNWYEGKELIFLIDFILSFLFITLYFKNQDLKFISACLGYNDNDKLQGVFYILLSCFILCIGISSQEKGLLYIINYFILFVTYVFLCVYKFSKNDMIKKINSYIFIVLGAFYWIIGILKIFNNLLNSSLKFMEPSD